MIRHFDRHPLLLSVHFIVILVRVCEFSLKNRSQFLFLAHPGVNPAGPRQQFRVRPALYDRPLPHDEDLVGAPHRTQSVSDRDGGAALLGGDSI